MEQFSTNGCAVNGTSDYFPDPLTAFKIRRMIDGEIKAVKRMTQVAKPYHQLFFDMEDIPDKGIRREMFGRFLEQNIPDLDLRIEILRQVSVQIKDPSRKKKEEEIEMVGASGTAYPFELIMRAEDLESEPVEWLWEPRIPFGFLTLFAGRTGSGKSLVAIDIAARFSRGQEMPLGAEASEAPGGTLILSEDNVKHMLMPRIVASGADRTKIRIMTIKAMAKFRLEDQTMLDDAYEASGQPRLVIIDPPANFLKGRDENSNEQVRSVLMTLSSWAEERSVAVILITHCNKSVKSETQALDRVIGSISWTTATRIVHLLGTHPKDEESRLFAMCKTNLGELDRSATYRIVPSDGSSKVSWTGYCDLKARDVEAKSRDNTPTAPRAEKALGWLKEKFKEKMAWKSTELLEAGRQDGHSRSALWDVKTQGLIEIRAKPETDEDGTRYWTWYVLPGWDRDESPPAQLDDPPLSAF